MCGWCWPAGVTHHFGFLLGFHSFEGSLFFGALVCSVIKISSVEMAEELSGLIRRSAASSPPSASASTAPSSPVGVLGVVVWGIAQGMGFWWGYVRVGGYFMVLLLRRFHREDVLMVLPRVALVALLPILLLAHHFSLFDSSFVFCLGPCIFFNFRVQLC